MPPQRHETHGSVGSSRTEHISRATPTASFLVKDNERNVTLLTPIVEVFVILVDEVCRVLGILYELLDHVAVEELAIRFRYAPVQLPNNLARLRAVEEMNLRRSATKTDRCSRENIAREDGRSPRHQLLGII